MNLIPVKHFDKLPLIFVPGNTLVGNIVWRSNRSHDLCCFSKCCCCWPRLFSRPHWLAQRALPTRNTITPRLGEQTWSNNELFLHTGTGTPLIQMVNRPPTQDRRLWISFFLFLWLPNLFVVWVHVISFFLSYFRLQFYAKIGKLKLRICIWMDYTYCVYSI